MPKPTRIINHKQINQEAARSRLVAGLRAPSAMIEPKYFYDPLGCAIYGAICLLDEYYPTRTERAIFAQYQSQIVEIIGQGGTFIDIGAGDCAKALDWLPLIAAKRYVAIDIAESSLATALANMAGEFPATEMIGLAIDFSQTLSIPPELLADKVTLFYPGSSIGNFTPTEATRFLREMRDITLPSGGGLIIGVDAKKPKALLDAAYDDKLGVTAAFNLNALRHINRVLGCDFDISQWRHVGDYNEALGRVEMHLESLTAQNVTIDGAARVFAEGEKIHSENSYKYHRDEFEALLRAAGFSEMTCWTDAAKAFWVFYAK